MDTVSLATMGWDVAPRTKKSNYPEPYASQMAGRENRALGNHFGLTNFGVNLTRLVPGAQSALLHSHTKQDEFVYVLEGEAVLVTDLGEVALTTGMCAGFPKGGHAHMLANRTHNDVVYLEIGDRSPDDTVNYPADDLAAVLGADGNWEFRRKGEE